MLFWFMVCNTPIFHSLQETLSLLHSCRQFVSGSQYDEQSSIKLLHRWQHYVHKVDYYISQLILFEEKHTRITTSIYFNSFFSF